jgi:hypothetical protein
MHALNIRPCCTNRYPDGAHHYNSYSIRPSAQSNFTFSAGVASSIKYRAKKIHRKSIEISNIYTPIDN